MSEEKKIGPLKAIRLKCLECSNGQYNEVRLCPCTDCPLYTFRDGHNPNRKGVGNAKALHPDSVTSSDIAEDGDEEIITEGVEEE